MAVAPLRTAVVLPETDALRLDCAVVVALVPLPEVAVAEIVGTLRVGEQSDDAILRLALGAGLFRHWGSSVVSAFAVAATFSALSPPFQTPHQWAEAARQAVFGCVLLAVCGSSQGFLDH